MIIVRLQGGLGNQMFQYACAKNLALRLSSGVRFDLSDLLDDEQRTLHTPRYYELGCFRLPQEFATEQDLTRFTRTQKPLKRLLRHQRPCQVLREQAPGYDSRLIEKAGRRMLLIGHWQSEKYFLSSADTVRRDFQLSRPLSNRARTLIDGINDRNSVSVHVRRGDYVSNAAALAHHGVCGEKYYQGALVYARERIRDPLFVFFSDDPEWCRRNFGDMKEALFIEPSYFAAEDMFLMSRCRHHILANSSFSWWGAWLHPDPGKMVIAPRPWLSHAAKEPTDIIPDAWLRMDR
jgi:hypothetical protein